MVSSPSKLLLALLATQAVALHPKAPRAATQCNNDLKLRALSKCSSFASTYCKTDPMATSTPLPSCVSSYQPSDIASACSCFLKSQTATTTGSTTSTTSTPTSTKPTATSTSTSTTTTSTTPTTTPPPTSSTTSTTATTAACTTSANYVKDGGFESLHTHDPQQRSYSSNPNWTKDPGSYQGYWFVQSPPGLGYANSSTWFRTFNQGTQLSQYVTVCKKDIVANYKVSLYLALLQADSQSLADSKAFAGFKLTPASPPTVLSRTSTFVHSDTYYDYYLYTGLIQLDSNYLGLQTLPFFVNVSNSDGNGGLFLDQISLESV